jgi:hypothetical protein
MFKTTLLALIPLLLVLSCTEVSKNQGADAWSFADTMFLDSGQEDTMSRDSGQKELPNFAGPQGVAATEDFVFVANPNWSFDENQKIVYGQGFVTVVDRSNFAVVNKIPTNAKNPQIVKVHKDRVYVLCSGATYWDTKTNMVVPDSPSSIESFSISSATTATTTTVHATLPLSQSTPLVGYPSSLVILDNDIAYASSGTTAVVFKFDLKSNMVLRGTENPIVLGDIKQQDSLVLEKGPNNILFIGSFNRDIVIAFDMSTDTNADLPFSQIDVSKTPNIDGVQDLAYYPSGQKDLFVLLGLASTVQALNTTMGQPSVETFVTTGQAPNKMKIVNNTLLVINSLDNNITGYSVGTRKQVAQVAFATQTNPFDMAILQTQGKTYLYVTGNMAQALYEVELESETITRQAQ